MKKAAKAAASEKYTIPLYENSNSPITGTEDKPGICIPENTAFVSSVTLIYPPAP